MNNILEHKEVLQHSANIARLFNQAELSAAEGIQVLMWMTISSILDLDSNANDTLRSYAHILLETVNNLEKNNESGK